MFAENLTHGFYSPRDAINLWNGPGYPLALAPFVALNTPLIMPTLANAVFLFLAVAYVYSTLRLYVPKSRALLAAHLFGIYPANLVALPLLITESLAVFLVCGFVHHFASLAARHPGARRHLLLAAFYLGYLALTKVIFGYVIAALLVVAVVAAIWTTIRQRGNLTGALPMLAVCLLALALCLPYLAYTRSLTGKVFYWSNSGGSSLYWMSTPYWDELGDWHTNSAVFEDPLLEEHREVLAQILLLDSIQQDDAVKAMALKNIARYPAKVLYNWAANVGRLLFNFPYSHTPQKLDTFFYLIPNMFLVVPFLLSMYPALRFWKAVPKELPWLLLFAGLALWASSVLSAYVRMLAPIVPVLVVWIAVAANRFVAIGVWESA